MSGTSEAYIQGLYGTRFSAEDQDARMDALLWQGDSEGAARQAVRVSPQNRGLAMARLSLLQGSMPDTSALAPNIARSDPGYVYNCLLYRSPDRSTICSRRASMSARVAIACATITRR